MEKLRVFFEKTSLARYVSHLDLIRLVSRAINRSNIKILYTQGFNPHPYLVFGNPLSLGFESLCEFFDIELNCLLTADEVKEKLSAQMPDGFRIVDVTAPIMPIGDTAYASYRMRLETENAPDSGLSDKLSAAFTSGQMLLEKKSKSGIKTVDLIPLIEKARFSIEDGCLLIDTTLPSGSAVSVNPSMLTDGIRLVAPELGEINAVSVMKYEMLNKNKVKFQ